MGGERDLKVEKSSYKHTLLAFLTLWGMGLEILPVAGTEHFLGTLFF